MLDRVLGKGAECWGHCGWNNSDLVRSCMAPVRNREARGLCDLFWLGDEEWYSRVDCVFLYRTQIAADVQLRKKRMSPSLKAEFRRVNSVSMTLLRVGLLSSHKLETKSNVSLNVSKLEYLRWAERCKSMERARPLAFVCVEGFVFLQALGDINVNVGH